MTTAAPPVVAALPGQDQAVVFLARAAAQPHHAYLFSGPEGSGKRLGMRAFAAALLCKLGGCGDCRDCRLALGERHPNMVVLEPTGPDILVGKDSGDRNTARWFAAQAHLSPVEQGRKVMVVLQADRLRIEAADVLLKVLEEPAADTVFVLLSARPDDLPETITSRCQHISFPPLEERFVVETLVAEGADGSRAQVAARLSGGNVGRARRIARDEGGLRFRDAAVEAADLARKGPSEALAAVDLVLEEAGRFKDGLSAELDEELRPFLGDDGRPEEHFRGIVRRLQERHERRVRRAKREFLDWTLLALSAYLRDRIASSSGAGGAVINLDLDVDAGGDAFTAAAAAVAMAETERARADLADETNLNERLVLERLFLRLSSLR